VKSVFGIVAAALVVLADQSTKQWLVVNQTNSIHQNTGILFDLPLPKIMILITTIALGAMLLFLAIKEWKKNRAHASALVVILVGGLGNFVDRITLGFTADYLFLPGGLAFNLSDVVIVLGIILALITTKISTGAFDKHPQTG